MINLVTGNNYVITMFGKPVTAKYERTTVSRSESMTNGKRRVRYAFVYRGNTVFVDFNRIKGYA